MNRNQWVSLVIATALLLALVPAPALAAERAGGTVVVDEGETVDGDLTAMGGTVVVRGNVTGDLDVTAGSVLITGTVGGDVSGAAGSVQIDGRVGGSVRTGTGALTIGPSAVIEGGVDAGAGSATIDGTIRGTVRIGAETITIGPTATVGGDLIYDGTLQQSPDATVQGSVTHDPGLATGADVGIPALPPGLDLLVAFLAHVVLGAILLLVFPGLSERTVAGILNRPGRSVGLGLLMVLAIPILAVITMVTIVGIPLALVALLLYLVGLWIGFVYAGLAIGDWLFARFGVDSRWGALAVGLAALVLVDVVPIAGALLQFVALLFGFGGFLRALRGAYRAGRGSTRTVD